MEKLRLKNNARNSILGSQKQSVVTLHVDTTSQQKHSMTISDTKAELVAITVKWLETCHSKVTCICFNMHCWLVSV